MKLLLMFTLLLAPTVEDEPDPINWELPCATSSTKSYMDYKAVTLRSSKQYKYIEKYMTVRDGLLYDSDGSIGVALGSWWGDIGAKWTIELSNGQIFDVVKIDEKADNHVVGGCYHKSDGSVIEMVVDSTTTPNKHWGSNGLIWNGNFNNYDKFKGTIKRIGKKIIKPKVEVIEEVDISAFMPPVFELKFEYLN